MNLSIDRNKVGLVLNVDKPEFQTIKNTYKTSESKDKVKSLSKTLFMGKFGLTQEALEEGLREGDFQQVIDKNGKIKYSWENMEHVTTRGKGSSSQQVENRSGTDKDAKLFAKQSKGMHLGLFGASGTQSSGSARHQPTDLALEDQPARSMNPKQLQGAKVQLNKAVAAFEKVLVPAKKLLQSMDKSHKLYAGLILGNSIQNPKPLNPTHVTKQVISCYFSSVTFSGFRGYR